MSDGSRRNADTWLERMAALQSYPRLILQLVLWSAIVIYGIKATVDSGQPTPAGVVCLLIFGPLLLFTLATLFTKIRNGSNLAGPLPEQLELQNEVQGYLRSVQRPRRRVVWLTVVVLLAIALVELIIQAFHRDAPPGRETARPMVEARLTIP